MVILAKININSGHLTPVGNGKVRGKGVLIQFNHVAPTLSPTFLMLGGRANKIAMNLDSLFKAPIKPRSGIDNGG